MLHNDGVAVGLIRPSGTRFAGYILAFLREIAVQPVFDSTMAAPNYSALGVPYNLTDLLKCGAFWTLKLTFCQAVYGGLWILRLGDSETPNMDKVLYYIHQMDEQMKRQRIHLNQYDDPDYEEGQYLNELLDSVCQLRTTDDDSTGDFPMPAEATDDVEDITPGTQLGDWLLHYWSHRRKYMIHPYTIAAWMLCPHPSVRADVKA